MFWELKWFFTFINLVVFLSIALCCTMPRYFWKCIQNSEVYNETLMHWYVVTCINLNLTDTLKCCLHLTCIPKYDMFDNALKRMMIWRHLRPYVVCV